MERNQALDDCASTDPLPAALRRGGGGATLHVYFIVHLHVYFNRWGVFVLRRRRLNCFRRHHPRRRRHSLLHVLVLVLLFTSSKVSIWSLPSAQSLSKTPALANGVDGGAPPRYRRRHRDWTGRLLVCRRSPRRDFS